MNDCPVGSSGNAVNITEMSSHTSASIGNYPPTCIETPSTSGWVPAIPFDEVSIVHNNGETSHVFTPRINPLHSPYHGNFNNLNRNKSIRRWEKVTPISTKNTITDRNGLQFVIISYNILSQTLLEAHSYLYEMNAQDTLKWNYRFTLIKNEIAALNPDIICLQEVQKSHLDSIALHFSKLGYDYVFKQRTGVRVDGCAIFFRKSAFDLVDHHSVEFLQPKANILNRDNIGLMLKLAPKSLPETQLVVCTTHLLYNPKREDVRLAQMKVFLAEIDRFAFYYDSALKKPQHLPVILTGDLNSHPSTPIASLIADGRFDTVYPLAPLKNISITDSCQHLGVYLQRKHGIDMDLSKLSMLHNSESDSKTSKSDLLAKYPMIDYKHLFYNTYIQHQLHFSSVYEHIKRDGQYEATTHQDEWKTVDYIYYTSNNTVGDLHLLERFRLPTATECEGIWPIPNLNYGSDHLCLGAKFLLFDTTPKAGSSDISKSQ